MRNAVDIEYARLDSDQTFAFSLQHDGKLIERDRIAIQIAILHTDRSGVRKIRVHNVSFAATASHADVFRGADLDAIITLITKSAISHCTSLSLSQLRQQILERMTRILAGYRKFCSSHSPSGQVSRRVSVS
jgi:protein transport protein SEC24